MKTLEQMVHESGILNRKAEDQFPVLVGDALAAEARFLLRWSKGNIIRRESADSTFWSCKGRMTKIAHHWATAFAAAGLATLGGDPKVAGAQLVMVKPAAVAAKPKKAKQKKLRMCSTCSTNPVDSPSQLCAGCEAYQEHQQ